MLSHLVGAVEGLENLFLPLEHERDGHDSDGQHLGLFREARHHRGGPGAGASAHAGRDEHHFGAVFKQFPDFVCALFRTLSSDFRIVACATAVGYVPSKKEFCRHGRHVEMLFIGVAHHEIHVRDVLTIHIVDRVAATASDSNHLDD